jgi:hypothetical protein
MFVDQSVGSVLAAWRVAKAPGASHISPYLNMVFHPIDGVGLNVEISMRFGFNRKRFSL